MDKKRQTMETYDRSAAALAEKFNAVGVRGDDVTRAFSYLSVKNPKVLEIGCGNGRDAVEILKHTSDYLGVDYSQGLLDIARQYVPNARFERADVEEYNFPSGLDAIFAFASLLHSNKETLGEVLNRAYQTLNEDGIFFISLKKGTYTEETKNEEYGTRTFYYYEPKDIRELVAGRYKVVHENVQTLRGQDWLEMILQR
jgi:SAM-dependent methyltransferase